MTNTTLDTAVESAVSAGLARLAVLVYETPHDSDRMIRDTLALVQKSLGAGAIFLARFGMDTLIVEHAHDDAAMGLHSGDEFALCDTYCNVLRERAASSLVVGDARRDPDFRHLCTTTALGIGAYMGVALHRADRTMYGTLCALYPDTHREEAGEIALLALAGRVFMHAVAACALRESEHRFRMLVEVSPVGGCIVDEHGMIESANEAFCALYGHAREGLIGQNAMLLVPEAARPEEMARFRRSVATGRGGQREATVTTKGGDRRTVLVDTVQYAGLDGRPRRASYVTDITRHKAENEAYRHAAYHDALTALPNRALFAMRLGAALEGLRTRGAHVAVLSLDLNGFKAINDTYGHEAGDIVLQVIAERMRSRMQADDMVARMGGDEFMVLLPSVRRAADAARVAANLAVTVGAPVAANGREVAVTPSIGIGIAPQHGETATALLAAADAAMYAAKRRGTSVSFSSGEG